MERLFMNKLLSISILFLIIPCAYTLGMDQAEGAAHQQITQRDLDQRLARQREEGRIRRQRENRNNRENNPPARRNLGVEFDLYQPNRGEGAYPVNNDL